MATENILMYCVQKGGDRQTLHEAIRRHSVETAKEIKLNGADNDLLDRILADPVFALTKEEMDGILQADRFTGRAKEQTQEYLKEVIRPLLAKYQEEVGESPEIHV